MKIAIDNNNDGFKPFNVTMTIESIQEARLLFHVLNNSGIWSLISKDVLYNTDVRYNEEVSPHFDCGEAFVELRGKIKSMGYDV